MKKSSSLTRTLGPVSVRFINDLLKSGKVVFALKDAVDIYESDEHETIKFLSDLIARGILARIKPGVYIILQMGQEAAQLSNWPVIAQELANPDKYYLSYYSAMRIHGMTTHPLFDVYISITKRRRNRTISNFKYHFIYVNADHFWGYSNLWISKHNKVCISDLERTILDGLERPELCGGVKEVVRGIWSKKNELDWQKLEDYASRFRTKSAIKRLGYILELLEIGKIILPVLVKSITNAEDYSLLDPSGVKEGKRIRRWYLRINIDIEELKASVWG